MVAERSIMMVTVEGCDPVRVELEGSTPVTPCPCASCGALVAPEDCLAGWGILQHCEPCEAMSIADPMWIPRDGEGS